MDIGIMEQKTPHLDSNVNLIGSIDQPKVFIKLKQCRSLVRSQNYVNYNHFHKNPQTMIMNLLSKEL